MARLVRTAPWTREAGSIVVADSMTAASQILTDAVEAPPDDHLDELAIRRIIARAQAAERRKISRLLHDEIGQSLTALNVKLAVLRGQSRGSAQTQIGSAQQLLEKALGDVQRLSQELHPSAVEDLGLIPALRSHINNFSRKASFAVKFKADERVAPSDVDLSLAVFRSVQALLSDLQLSAAARAELFLGLGPGALVLDASAKMGGRQARQRDAVPNMAAFHEQVLLAGGTVNVRAHRNQALISARFPMTNHESV